MSLSESFHSPLQGYRLKVSVIREKKERHGFGRARY